MKIVHTLPKPSETKAIEWVHPEATKQLIETSSSNALIHFSPVAIWAKQIPSYFIPLTLPHLTGHLSWLKLLLEKKRFNKTMQGAKQVLALDEWHAQNRIGVTRLYLEKAPLPFMLSPFISSQLS